MYVANVLQLWVGGLRPMQAACHCLAFATGTWPALISRLYASTSPQVSCSNAHTMHISHLVLLVSFVLKFLAVILMDVA